MLAAFGTTLMLSACASFPMNYNEKISEVYISLDSKRFFVIGKNHLYQLDAPEALNKSLNSSFRNNLKIGMFSHFDISKSGDVSGNFTLILSKNATQEEKDEAIKLNYQTSKDGLIYSWNSIKGKRVSAKDADNFDVNALKLIPLNKEYSIQIIDHENFDAKKGALTYGSLATGTAIVVAAPVIILFSLPMMGLRP